MSDEATKTILRMADELALTRELFKSSFEKLGVEFLQLEKENKNLKLEIQQMKMGTPYQQLHQATTFEQSTVEKILDKKMVAGSTHYFVMFRRYPEFEYLWEPKCNVNYPEMIKEFEKSLEKRKEGGGDKKRKRSTAENTSEVPSKKKSEKMGTPYQQLHQETIFEQSFIEEILDKKMVAGTTHYFVKMKRYPEFEYSWEPECNVNYPEMIKEFEESLEIKKEGGDDKKRKSSTAENTSEVPSKKKSEEVCSNLTLAI